MFNSILKVQHLKRQLICACLSAALHQPAAFAQEREWQLDAAEQDVFLVFGVPATEDVGISFWCRIGTRQLSMFAPLPAGTRPDQVAATSSLQIGTEMFPLVPVINTDGPKPTLEAPLAPSNKILNAFATAEKLKLTVAGHVSTFPLANANFQGLIRLCDRPEDQPEN